MPDYQTVQELADPIKFIEMFANITVEGESAELIEKLDACHGDPEALKDMMKDPNTMVMWKAYDIARSGYFTPSDDPLDENYNKSFINFLKICIVLFKQVPWWRSRLGWFMWFCACYANPDAYYPLMYEDHFEPERWYHAGEVPRQQREHLERATQPFVLG